MRRHHWLGVAGLVLFLVGTLGLMATGAWLGATRLVRLAPERTPQFRGPQDGTATPAPGAPDAPPTRPAVSLGERVFRYGEGVNGRRIPRSGPGMMHGDIGCGDCHGDDGMGRRIRLMMGTVRTPDIRYDTLTTQHEEGGRSESGWSDEEIRRAVTEGAEPGGGTLDWTMPRWRLNDEEFDALLGYLKELS